MISDMKFRNLFTKKYTGFQRMWVLIMLAVLAFSVVMTAIQAGNMIMIKRQKEKTAEQHKSAESISQEYKNDIPEQETTRLSETKDAGQDYLDTTLFLGDSNTVRFMIFTDSEGRTYTSQENTIAVVGMGIDAISTLKCMKFSTGTYTMTESVSIIQPERIIITFGTNNLSGTSTDASGFIQRYQLQLKRLQEAYPTVDIIVNSIPPVTDGKSKAHNIQIMAYNTAIEEMCEANGWKYLNSAEVLADVNGNPMPGFMEGDGIHLTKTAVNTLFDYIRTHAYVTEDDRPKPLAAIPNILGPTTNVYMTDPLTDKPFTEEALNPEDKEEEQPEETPTPTPAPSETPKATPTPTPTPQTTPEPTVTPTPEPSSTPEPTVEPTPVPTPESTPEPTPEPTPTPAPTPEQPPEEPQE